MGETILKELNYLIGVIVALVLGFAIGLERKFRAKEAGIRTHTVVAVGAALIMVVSKYGFEDGTADLSRIAAQIVSGVGFLGAGIIVYRQHEIHGLTTAAGVWATAGVGMAAGAGLYTVAAGATLILILSQCIFHIPCRIFRSKRTYEIKICFVNDGNNDEKVKQLFDVRHFNRLHIERKDGAAVYSAALKTDKEYSSRILGDIMAENPFIISLERCDDE